MCQLLIACVFAEKKVHTKYIYKSYMREHLVKALLFAAAAVDIPCIIVC